MTRHALTSIDIPGVKHQRRGKVRDIFSIDGKLLLVASDRISAFDVIMNEGIPDKGRILTSMSEFWFNRIEEAKPHHVITGDVDQFPEPFRRHPDLLAHRSMLVKQTDPLPVECVVRGYLAGSAWVEYQQGIPVGGNQLPQGLRESDRLPKPIFSPATKSTEGHDINITFDQMVEMIGGPLAEEARDRALAIYNKGSELADRRGENVREKLEQLVLENERVQLHQLAISEYERIPTLVNDMVEVIEEVGMNPFKGM